MKTLKKFTVALASLALIGSTAVAQNWAAGTNRLYANPATTTDVGIGTTAPNCKLHVNSTSTTLNAFRVQINGATRFCVTPNGGAVVGMFSSASPARGLYVYGGLTVGTSTLPTGFKAAIDGKLICEEIYVRNSTNWPDYVFSKDYELTPLNEVAEYIEANNHLPNVPSAETLESEGISVGEMQKIQMEKIEELTLYILQLQEKIEKLESQK